MNKYFLIYLGSVFIASVSQVLLKKSANIQYSRKIGEYLNKYVISAYFILVISTFLTIIAFKGIQLKNGPIIEAFGYIFILILGRIFLKEKITKRKLVGNLLIIAGIVIFVL